MKYVLIRVLFVWLLLNVILLPIEWFRYLSPHGFVDSRMWDITAFVIGIDIVILVVLAILPILQWILAPILN